MISGAPSFGPLGNAGPSNAGSSAAFNFATGAVGSGSGLLGGNTGTPSSVIMQYLPWAVVGGLVLWIVAKK